MDSVKPKLVVIAGPTGVGKSNFAIEVAKEIDGEIVSLDSVQVYKGLDIGSAKVKKTEMQDISHYMIDEVEPTVNLSVKEFKDMAKKYIDSILAKNKIPILVGGTGFYIHAVLYDNDFIYEDDAEVEKIRKELYDLYEKNGIDYILTELKKVDEKSYEKIEKGNVKRIIRAIEFYRLHNIPISTHNEIQKNKESIYDFMFIVLTDDREKLYERTDRRVEKMFDDGFISEVKDLISRGITIEYNAMKSIGYKELYEYITRENKIDLQQVKEEIKKNTRNYVKRQLTWFKKEKNILWMNANEKNIIVIKNFIENKN